MQIYCCECKSDVEASLISGREVYPHRQDLHELPFWSCPYCNNTVGCHHKTSNRTKPLGVIANQEMKNARQHIHSILDPLWQSGRWTRNKLYKHISKIIGYEYHTAEIKTIEEARNIYKIIKELT